MSDYIHWGIIESINLEKDYSQINGGPNSFQKALDEYHCIGIPDDIMNNLIPWRIDISTFFQHLHNPGRGIDHYGVTLIPPDSVKELKMAVVSRLDSIDKADCIYQLIALFTEAIEKDQYVICFGI